MDVSPSTLSYFAVTAPPTAYNDTAFHVEVVGKDSYGNARSGVTGATSVSVSSGSVSPTSLASVPYSGDFTIYSANPGSNTLTFTNGSVVEDYVLNAADVLMEDTSGTNINVTQVVTSEITISNPGTITMSPNILGMTGGTADGNATWNVKTNNASGFSLSIKSSTNPTLQSAESSFADYTLMSSGTPDFNWNIDPASSEFGFSIEPAVIADTAPLFRDNGSICATGNDRTAGKCWYPFTTSDLNIVNRFSATSSSGEDVLIKLRAQAGPSRFQTQGSYQAVVTLTAVTN